METGIITELETREKKIEALTSILKVLIDWMVNRHLLPGSPGTLTCEIRHLHEVSGLPEDIFYEVLKELLPQCAIMIISREESEAMVRELSRGLENNTPAPKVEGWARILLPEDIGC